MVLILSSVRLHRAVIKEAIATAKSSAQELVILSVLDRAIPRRVAEQFADSGQIGTRPSEGFLDSLYKRHEQLALDQAQDILSEAQRQGVTVSSEVRRGDYAQQTAEALSTQRPAVVVMEKRRRSLLRFATEDAFIDKLKAEVGFRLIEV
ncbi:MAG: hypothetical protein VCA74_08435 [Deltaproteobacteria bacterium]